MTKKLQFWLCKCKLFFFVVVHICLISQPFLYAFCHGHINFVFPKDIAFEISLGFQEARGMNAAPTVDAQLAFSGDDWGSSPLWGSSLGVRMEGDSFFFLIN